MDPTVVYMHVYNSEPMVLPMGLLVVLIVTLSLLLFVIMASSDQSTC